MAFVNIREEGVQQDPQNPILKYDEFHQMRIARYMTSFEAFLSLWGQPLTKRSHKVCYFKYFICIF